MSMTHDYDSVLAVSQMMLRNLLVSRRVDVLTQDVIRDQADAAAKLMGATDLDLEKLVEDLFARFNVYTQRAAILRDDSDHADWVKSEGKASWRFWPRCEKHLLGMLPEPVVRRIDEDTDKILNLLGDPTTSGPWDRRGLVVGDVQFGKTSNYAALACKAADAGYRLIIILAGMHESLRMQTQIRMDETFLGFRTDQSNEAIGVGLIDPSVQAVAATTRTVRGDFNKIVANQLAMPVDSGPPILLVVKKNANMLRNLLSWLEKLAKTPDATGRRVITNAPALIVDDESDNASVDTGEQDFDRDENPDLSYQPKAINDLIRRILATIESRSYVGYTATPFANIFIHKDGETAAGSRDLFPRNFIVNLHAPSNYFGASQAFGLELSDDEPQTGAPLIRLIDEAAVDRLQLEAWIPRKHKQHHVPAALPQTLHRALLSFIITCATRKLRGQATEHNSMLVHVTRFTKIQAVIYAQVDEAMTRIRRRLRYGDADAAQSIRTEMKALWENDFLPTNFAMREMHFTDAGEMPAWEKVDATLADVASGIRIKQINGLAQDVLDYDSARETGIDVIAIGGDKLSRGLTLYGLSVSYFSRQTDMYDTLLQMGRWFGYRPGYLDLCRLYTTVALNDAFEHIALASDELRRDFDYMESIGKTPKDFGLRVLAHPVLAPTAANKRRHARDILLYVSYDGIISETKSFSLHPTVLSSNKSAADRLVDRLHASASPVESPAYSRTDGTKRTYTGSWLWTDVPSDFLLQFFNDYQTEPSAKRASSRLWRKFISDQNARTNDLLSWNVALIGGDKEATTLGVDYPHDLLRRTRARDSKVNQDGGYRIKRLVTTRDAGIDLSDADWERAKAFDPNDRRTGKLRTEPSGYGICSVRQERSLNPLMMLYLPVEDDLALLEPPVIGIALVFPGSDRAVTETVRYTVNTVYGDEEEEEEVD